MAIVEAPGPLALPSGEPSTNGREHPLGVFARPGQSKGWRSWVTSVDHKRIGIMYGVTAIAFFMIGGVEALTGILMCGWSAAFFFAVVSRMNQTQPKPEGP